MIYGIGFVAVFIVVFLWASMGAPRSWDEFLADLITGWMIGGVMVISLIYSRNYTRGLNSGTEAETATS